MTQDEIVRYWIETAEDNFASMKRIFSADEYVWALFVGHLVIEKLLKACCARTLGKEVPKTHNLLWLAEIANLETTEVQKETLSRLMLYQIKARYLDWRKQFQKSVSRERAEREIAAMEALREWLLQVLSKQSSR